MLLRARRLEKTKNLLFQGFEKEAALTKNAISSKEIAS
jgi:hypothetical protein